MDNLVEFIKVNKNYTDLEAKKAAYQLKIFLNSLVYTTIILFILFFMGLLKEGIIVFIFFKMFRGNAGGIHLKNYIVCFITSFLAILGTILLARFIKLTLVIELVMYCYVFLIWYLYVPQGTSQRPFRRIEEKKKMKYKMFLYMVVTIVLRFINTDLYKLGIWSLVVSLTIITPVVYKIFHVKHDRI